MSFHNQVLANGLRIVGDVRYSRMRTMSGASLNQRDGAAPATVVSNGLSPSMVRRAIFASVLGNGLEWFDFLIYGYFAKIIALVFFPGGSGFVSIMLTLATFAVGFIVRPIGGILFGIYADRAGRRKALSLLVDRDAIKKVIYGRAGRTTANFLNGPEQFVSKNTSWEFSIEKASKLLDDAGWKVGT